MACAGPSAARVPVPAAFWRRHKDEAAALDRFDGFAGQARDGSVQLRLGHGTSFRENGKWAREASAFFGQMYYVAVCAFSVLCRAGYVRRARSRARPGKT
jgi:hypothetical protein